MMRTNTVVDSAPHRESSEAEFRARRDEYTRDRISFWDGYAETLPRWERWRRHYRERLAEIYRTLIPPGKRVLELGCGPGDLLTSLRPSYGVGVDSSSKLLDIARRRHPGLHFVLQDAHAFELNETFDYVVCSDLVNDLWDVQEVFASIRRHIHASTRLILNFYSRLWEIPRRLAEAAGVAKPQPVQNWLTTEDVTGLLFLENFEVIRHFQEILWPFRLPLVDTMANRYLVKIAPFRWFALTNVLVARPRSESRPGPEPVVTVVVPARNEAGNIPHIVDRVPQMGARTELIFVEGNSKDNTLEAIRNEIDKRPGCQAKLFQQTGKGKGDAVRLGFANATGDVLMILDADLTVPPEDLPRFYQAWRSGKGDFINGVRLIYPMEDRAMRFFNLLGNKFFSLAFSWLLGQSIKDTLCGTKVLSRADYETIAANRAWFGQLDPFGDFDLIFGAARFSLKIVDLPIRYRERTYGETNIQRWSHGWLLLKMLFLAMRRLKFV
jgi:SAM-dependent methyltransferase